MNAELFDSLPPPTGDSRHRLGTPLAIGIAQSGKVTSSASAPQLPTMSPFQKGRGGVPGGALSGSASGASLPAVGPPRPETPSVLGIVKYATPGTRARLGSP